MLCPCPSCAALQRKAWSLGRGGGAIAFRGPQGQGGSKWGGNRPVEVVPLPTSATPVVIRGLGVGEVVGVLRLHVVEARSLVEVRRLWEADSRLDSSCKLHGWLKIIGTTSSQWMPIGAAGSQEARRGGRSLHMQPHVNRPSPEGLKNAAARHGAEPHCRPRNYFQPLPLRLHGTGPV